MHDTSTSHRRSYARRSLARHTVFALALAASLATALPASADPSVRTTGREPSNPLRIAYFVLHPVGRLLDWAIIRPINYVGESVTPVTELARIEASGCHRERPPRGCAHERR